MATLDYAFLADFAKVEPNGALTAVGASFTFLQAETLPSQHRMAVAGRVRAKLTDGSVTLRVEVLGPDDTFRLAAEGELAPSPEARPYGDGYIGHIFALDLQIPLPQRGLYRVQVHVNGEFARMLAFDVVPTAAGDE